MRRALGISLSLGLTACVDRTEPRSDVAVATAEHLCAVQSSCGCEAELLLDDCEKQVEQAVTKWERGAIDAGLQLDRQCLDAWLETLDGLASCTPWPEEDPPSCPVYSAGRGVDEPCEIYSFYPPMTDCRAGLECRDGACRDVLNPKILQLGERCSEEHGHFVNGFLGVCDEGLICDQPDSLTCVVAPIPVPSGGDCVEFSACEAGAYCRTPSPEDDPADTPGICTLATTPEGAPCQYVFECATTVCLDGSCLEETVALCGLLGGWAEAVVLEFPLPPPPTR